jgi:hypothetical protein
MMRARRLILTVLGVLAGGLLFSSAPAPATTAHVFSSSFGSATSMPSDPAPLLAPSGVAVNDATEDVYVVDKGNKRVEEFNAGGTFLKEFVPTGGFSNPEAIAIDNSGSASDPSKEYVYITDVGNNVIDKFSAAGKYEGELTGTCAKAGESPPSCVGSAFIAFSALRGVAVDPKGNVWVYNANTIGQGEAFEFNDLGTYLFGFPTEHETTPGIAVDSEDNLYLLKGTPNVEKFSSSGVALSAVTECGCATGVAIDQATNELFVDQGSSVADYGPFGSALVEEFGSGQLTSGGGSGIAVNSANGTVYVADSVANVVDSFAGVPLPDVTTGAPSNIQPQTGNVTLNGAVNPLEDEAKSEASGIEFEYVSEEAFKAPFANEVQSVTFTNATGGDFTLDIEGNVTAPIPLKTAEPFEVQSALEALAPIGAGNVEVTGSAGGPYTIEFKGALAHKKLPSLGTEVSELKPHGACGAEAPALTPNGACMGITITTEGGDGGWHTATTVKASPEEATGNSQVAVTAKVSGLFLKTAYYYRLNATNATGRINHSPIAAFTIRVSPAVDDQPATVTDVGRASAVFQGTVNPENSETFYHFAYVPAGEYQPGASNPYAGGGATEEVSAGAGIVDEPVGPVPVGDLLPGTTYHYALVASNTAGSSIGEDHTFTTTPGTPPVATTGGASAVSQNSATLSGTVSTNSLQTEYGFEIGTEPGTYSPATGLGSLGGATTETVTLTLGELQPGTTYHYRITATSSAGTVQGEPEAFTTPGFPTLLTAPTAPSLVATPAIAFPTETGTTTTTTTKALTRTQKLAAALKVCKKESKNKRASCQKQARQRYGPVKQKSKQK